MEEFKDWVRNEITDLKTKLAVHNERIDALEKSISKIESNTTWTMRLIFGALIGAILRLVLKGGI